MLHVLQWIDPHSPKGNMNRALSLVNATHMNLGENEEGEKGEFERRQWKVV